MTKLKKTVTGIILIAVVLSMTFAMSACKDEGSSLQRLLDPENPITVEIWNYYSSVQGEAFDKLVKEFNDTVGRETGIIISTTSLSNINTLADELINAVDGKVGAQAVPDLAAIYPETAFLLKEKGAIVPVQQYLTDEEWAEYIPSFLDSGRFSKGGEIYGFPVSKSTEVLAYNSTDWAPFEEATGYSIADIKTAEDMGLAAKAYYEWTDAATPDVAEDGKALYGRDSMANYLFIGAAKLGQEISSVDENNKVTVKLDKATMRTLWDNYYVPYVNGYFAHYGRFRSDGMKTADILAFTGSTSSVSYIKEEVVETKATATGTTEEKHSITLSFAKPLELKEQATNTYIQQGASYYVMKSTDAKQYAATLFLKWFTAQEQNVLFSVNAGYSPVKKEANKEAVLVAAMEKADNPRQNILTTLKISADIFNNQPTYSAPAFTQAKDLRSYLETSFDTILKTDREKVVNEIKAGKTRAAAVAPFVTDAYFDAWYNTINGHVTDMMK